MLSSSTFSVFIPCISDQQTEKLSSNFMDCCVKDNYDLLRPCYIVQFSHQLVSLEMLLRDQCETTGQCNMGCLAIFLLREALHKVELSSIFRNGLQQLTTPLHSVSPLQHFMAVLTREHAHTSCFSFRGTLRDKLLKK